MTNRILFVDDEQSLLNGIERRLGSDFDLITANSGMAGLLAMDSNGPFAVIVTDMRMPRMDGIQFIKEARLKSRDSVFIMLTGNQDQTTATQALNEGHVFRFLTKPCPSADIVTAIEGGLRQYQLVTAEKELLLNTFYGAVGVLTDVMEITQPIVFSRSGRIQDIVDALGSALKLEMQWEYKLAARLALVGLALLPDDDRIILEFGIQSSECVNECFTRAAEIGERLIQRIPRLDTVARMIGMQSEVNGSAIIQSPKTEDAKALMGATLLRVAIHWDFLTRQGLRSSTATDEMRRSLVLLSTEMIGALNGLDLDDEDDPGVEIRLADIVDGMVLAGDLLTQDGTILMGKGRRVTRAMIEKLSCYPAADLPPIRIKKASLTMAGDLVLM